jgi:phytoene dehydrogenase-like protein
MKINIIGAGVAGLSAGCYLQMNGFETEIFERHSTSGGLCTSWNRNGYTFESGLQWLLGSNNSNPFYQLWAELIDMKSLQFIHHETRMDIEMKTNADRFGDKIFHLYTNLNRLEDYLLTIAPEDTRSLKKLVGTIRQMQNFELPPLIKVVPELLPWCRKILLIKHLKLLFFLNRVKKETNFSYAGKLKNPFLKEAFQLLFDGDEKSLLILTMPLAFNDLRGTGYPVGGSALFVRHLENRYRELGGKIRFSCEVEKIMTSENRTTGICLESGEIVKSEMVISAADWNFTLFKALQGKFVTPAILSLKKQEKLKVYPSVFLVSLGVAASLQEWSHFFRFPLDKELLSPDGTRYNRMELHINNYDHTLAPAGKSVISVSFYTFNPSFWIELRKSDNQSYLSQKQLFAHQIIEILMQKTGLSGKLIEITDIATPATFERYTNNWMGSVQGWEPGKDIIARSPVKPEIPGLKDFYMVGHWSIPGGGLPVAVKSARDVAQIICHRKGIPFKIIPPVQDH